MAGPAALLARLDAAIAELQAIRAELAGFDALNPPAAKGMDSVHTLADDDLSPEHLLDTTSAQERFGHPRNTLAKWCREEGLGVRRGGRWLISIPRLQRHLNGP
jgi:hypothetical protein